MLRVIHRIVLVLALCSVIFTTAARAALIEIEASKTTGIVIGDTIDVSFRISGLSADPFDSLSAFDADILYDPAALAFSGFSFEDPLLGNQLDFAEIGSFGFAGDVFDFGGLLDVFGISGNSAAVLDALQADEFMMFSLSFVTLIDFTTTAVSLDTADPALLFLDSDFFDLDVTFVNDSVTLSTTVVPEPGTLALLGIGLFGMGLARRRKA